MPWPHNYCKDVPGAMDVTEDLQNCHCFYYCNNHEVAGHECCKPGLAFNPVLKAYVTGLTMCPTVLRKSMGLCKYNINN